MKICSLYGAGFYYIPGTDTCIKVGGFVRAEVNVNANGSYAQYNRINFDDRNASRYYTRTRGALTLDARSQTEYGTLRSYAVLAMQIDNGTPYAGAPNATVGGSDVRTWSNAFFIQFAGFTVGSTTSFFDFDSIAYSNQTNTWGSVTGGAGQPLAAYTAQLGNGLSATISAEDDGARRAHILGTGIPLPAAPLPAFGLPITIAPTGYGGKTVPDFVGNLRIDQAWGSAQLMGAVHTIKPGYYTTLAAGTGGPGSATGYAFGGGLKINLPMLGKGDYIIAQANWSKGATSYSGFGLPGIGGSGAQPNYSLSNGQPLSSAAYGYVSDATYGAVGTSLDLTKAWSITGGIEHNWVPGWKTSLYGAYGKISYSQVSSDRIAAAGATLGLPFAVGAGNDAGFSYYQIGSRTVWTPVTNLDLSVDVMYNKFNTAFANVPGYSDKSWFSGMFRAQRNFYP